MEFYTTENIQVQIYCGDITAQNTDAIVSSANRHLKHDVGVAKTIAAKAGPSYLDECSAIIKKHKKLEYKKCVHTSAGALVGPRFVLHAITPKSEGVTEDARKAALEDTIVNTLVNANRELLVTSLAIPLIGSGFYGVSINTMAHVMYNAIRRYSVSIPSGIRHLVSIRLVDKNNGKLKAFANIFKEISENDTSLRKLVIAEGSET